MGSGPVGHGVGLQARWERGAGLCPDLGGGMPQRTALLGSVGLGHPPVLLMQPPFLVPWGASSGPGLLEGGMYSHGVPA